MLLSESGADFLNQWDHGKNTITPDEITTGSGKQVWWTCQHGHAWTSSPAYRMRGYGDCPTCKSIGFLRPDLLEEWDHEKNTIDPFSVRTGSGKKAWWICRNNHSWEMVINNRSKDDQGCPYCSGQRTIPGINDLTTTHPQLARQWDHEKNDVPLEDVSYGSKIHRWWTDDCGHSWLMMPLHRSKLTDTSCPVCRSISVMVPEWVDQWHESNELSVEYTSPGSDKIVTWVHPDCGHTWKQSISTRYTSRDKLSCPICSGTRVLPGFNDLSTLFPDIAGQWSKDNTVTPDKVSRSSNMKALWECDKGHVWRAVVGDRTRGSGCPGCSTVVSAMETELSEIISSWGLDVVDNSRSIISPYEMDMYIPEKKIAVEFNGSYWHSDRYLSDDYHYRKWRMCQEKGIQLITVWDDDWKRKKDIVLSMLSHKLGVSTSKKIMARKTDVMMVDSMVAERFLNTYHIQGYSRGTRSMGLVDGDDLVAVSSWRKVGHVLYLDRYATSVTVVGGMGKLLKSGVRYAQEHGCTEIVTFADHQVSNGGLYEKLGFRLDSELEPDYQYLVSNRRSHKFNYRISRFRDDDELMYHDGMSEKELATLNGMYRVWDCGKSRYIFDVP